MQQYIIHVSKKIDHSALAVLREHGVEVIVHCRSIEIRLPLGSMQTNIVQEEDSIPEAGISAKQETRLYLLPDHTLVTWRRETIQTPQNFHTVYAIAAKSLAMATV